MRTGLVLVMVAIALSGCAHRKHARVALPPRPAPRVGDTETGIASWYGYPYHGRQAANGEIYDMEKLTAAHRTFPFNTWVRVINLSNDKTVEVRITDRGPFVGGRIIDLSHQAARAIDMLGAGTARVRIVVIQAPEVAVPGAFAVQVGVYQDRRNAERVRAGMAAQYGSARLVLREGNPVMWRVLVGAEPTEEDARSLCDRIRQKSSEKSAFVVRLDS